MKHLFYTLHGSPRHHYHHIYERQHHQGHKYHHGVGYEVLEVSRSHGYTPCRDPKASSYYGLCRKPGYEYHAGIYGKLHEKRVKGIELFNFCIIIPYIFRSQLKFISLMILPDKALYDPYAMQVLPDDPVQLIVHPYDLLQQRIGLPCNCYESKKKDRYHHNIYKTYLPVDGKCHK